METNNKDSQPDKILGERVERLCDKCYYFSWICEQPEIKTDYSKYACAPQRTQYILGMNSLSSLDMSCSNSHEYGS